jgi:type II secretory pathway component GspD/PulD (secretin)
MRLPTLNLALIFLLTSATYHSAFAQKQRPLRDQVVIQVIQLDYADAENLATVLTPFLSPKGRIVADSRTNSLIIKDEASVVRRLLEAIKGPIDP